MLTATTRPVRRPSEKNVTSSTMATASASTLTNSPTPSRTAAGWSATLRSCMPAGSVCCRRENSVSRRSPRRRMSPPGFIDTAMPSASSPMKRIRGAAGSAKPRCTLAMSPRRTVRSPARIGKARIASTESNSPLTRNCTRSLPVSKKPAGVTAFCSASACCTAANGMPSVASLVLDSSTQIFSSCRPSSSILPTSGTRCSSSSTRSA
jgi:hypothetical protein